MTTTMVTIATTAAAPVAILPLFSAIFWLASHELHQSPPPSSSLSSGCWSQLAGKFIGQPESGRKNLSTGGVVLPTGDCRRLRQWDGEWRRRRHGRWWTYLAPILFSSAFALFLAAAMSSSDQWPSAPANNSVRRLVEMLLWARPRRDGLHGGKGVRRNRRHSGFSCEQQSSGVTAR